MVLNYINSKNLLILTQTMSWWSQSQHYSWPVALADSSSLICPETTSEPIIPASVESCMHCLIGLILFAFMALFGNSEIKFRSSHLIIDPFSPFVFDYYMTRVLRFFSLKKRHLLGLDFDASVLYWFYGSGS